MGALQRPDLIVRAGRLCLSDNRHVRRSTIHQGVGLCSFPAKTNGMRNRALMRELGLKPEGGNYVQIRRHVARLNISVHHFKGTGWSRGITGLRRPSTPLASVLVNPTDYPSYKLKKRLFRAGLKSERCELCGWESRAADGRIPVELDHINGDRRDNRFENLRILCPNCHSLQPTHRGLNIRRKTSRAGGETG